jgi:hypothetical protein
MGCDNPGSMGSEAIDKEYRLYKKAKILDEDIVV